jgi:hypothetical protein
MTLNQIRERFLDGYGRDLTWNPEQVADFYESEFSKLIEEVKGKLDNKEHHQNLLGTGKYMNLDFASGYDKGIEDASQILTKVISYKK